MKRLLIYCEGQTEEHFVNRVLRHLLALHGVKVERAELALTSLAPQGKRGGFASWDAIEQDLRDIFATDTDPNLRFTTLLDVYAIPTKVPGISALPGPPTSEAEVISVEQQIEVRLSEPRFKAYLQRHEVEALLLADESALKEIFPRDAAGITNLFAQIGGFASAEEINHGALTHPAARLKAAIPGYEYLKADNFHWVLSRADMNLVRSKCPRFDAWLSHWENWGDQP